MAQHKSGGAALCALTQECELGPPVDPTWPPKGPHVVAHHAHPSDLVQGGGLGAKSQVGKWGWSLGWCEGLGSHKCDHWGLV